MKMELAGRILGDACINRLNLRTQLERVKIDRTGNGHDSTTPYGLDGGTTRIDGLRTFQLCGYVVLASSSDTDRKSEAPSHTSLLDPNMDSITPLRAERSRAG